MAAKKKVGDLIKEARTAAGLTQTALASKIKGLTASDISKAERGEKELTKEQLKSIAKITGVTQKSLLEAPSGASGKTTTTTTTSSAKKKTSSTASTTSVKLTATEKKLVEAYRAADAKTRKNAMNVLKGTDKTTAGILENFLTGILPKDMPELETDDEPVIYTLEETDSPEE